MVFSLKKGSNLLFREYKRKINFDRELKLGRTLYIIYETMNIILEAINQSTVKILNSSIRQPRLLVLWKLGYRGSSF